MALSVKPAVKAGMWVKDQPRPHPRVAWLPTPARPPRRLSRFAWSPLPPPFMDRLPGPVACLRVPRVPHRTGPIRQDDNYFGDLMARQPTYK